MTLSSSESELTEVAFVEAGVVDSSGISITASSMTIGSDVVGSSISTTSSGLLDSVGTLRLLARRRAELRLGLKLKQLKR